MEPSVSKHTPARKRIRVSCLSRPHDESIRGFAARIVGGILFVGHFGLGLAGWLVIPFAYGIDRHRSARTAGARD